MALKQVQLNGGVTRQPDDALSGNGTLSACVNMCSDGAGLQMLEKPTELFSLGTGERCVYIHQTATFRHFIIYNKTTKKVLWIDAYGSGYARNELIGCSCDELGNIGSIGNTLVLHDTHKDRMEYAMWKDGNYTFLGAMPEMVQMQFGLTSELCHYPENTTTAYKSNDITDDKYNHMIPVANESTVIPSLAELQQQGVSQGWLGYDFSIEGEDYQFRDIDIGKAFSDGVSNALLGSVNKLIARQTEKNRFVFPFFVRYAYELYDGSQVMHSYPVLMIPNSKGPVFAIDRNFFKVNSESRTENRIVYDLYISGNAYCYGSTLEVMFGAIPSDIAKWKGIIKGVGVYVTAPVYTYDQSGKIYGWHNMETATIGGKPINNGERWNDYYTVGRIPKEGRQYGKNMMLDSFKSEYHDFNPNNIPDKVKDKYPVFLLDIPQKGIDEIRENLHSAGQFYKVAEFSIDELVKIRDGKHSDYNTSAAMPLKMQDKRLVNIATREQMKDDYHTHDPIAPHSQIYTYNNRVNLGGVQRRLHNPIGMAQQLPIRNNGTTAYPCRVAVEVSENGRTYTVANELTTYKTNDKFIDYIFYPNRNAKKATVQFRGEIFELKLEEHPTLEGAYWCTPLWGVTDGTDYIVNNFPAVSENPVVNEFGKVYTSNDSNPFRFGAENINQVGDGEILALCANTQAVNSYNFGYATMYAFTDYGIWGLKVSDTGGFQSLQATSRDVLTRGTTPLQLGQSIVFLAERGVLRLDINSATPKVMSAQIDGFGVAMPDGDKISALTAATLGEDSGAVSEACAKLAGTQRFWTGKGAVMVYDYTHGRIYFSPNESTDRLGSWVYNLKSESWSHATTTVRRALNSYPECVFEDTAGKVSQIHSNASHYGCGLVVTRPIKTGGEWLAKVDAVVWRGNFRADTETVKTALFGSRDWRSYPLIATSAMARLTRRHGTGYRSHIVAAMVNASGTESGMLAMDYLTIEAEGKQADKPR